MLFMETFLLNSCCFLSIRRGCFLTAFGTLFFYSMLFLVSLVHLEEEQTLTLFFLTIVLLGASFLAVIASILLIIGLYQNKPTFLLFWIVSYALVNVIEFSIMIYLLQEGQGGNPFFFVMLFFDVTICLANMYGFLCVLSYLVRQRRDSNQQQDLVGLEKSTQEPSNYSLARHLEETSREEEYCESLSPQYSSKSEFNNELV